jgi:hypothetical protein
MDVHQRQDLARPAATELLAKLWLLSHALLVVMGLIYAAFVWPEPLLPA